MTKTDYFRRANEITEWTRLGMITQEEADRLSLVLELERRRAIEGGLTDEQKLEAARIGRIEFISAGATRKR